MSAEATRPVTSARDPRVVRAARLLRDPAACRAAGAVAVDGDDVLDEALAAGLEPELVLEDPGRAAEPAPWRARLAGRVAPAHAGPDALRALAALGQPPRVVAVLRLPTAPPPAPLPGGAVVLCELGDAGNVGSIVRTAAALGVPRVVPCGAGADPLVRRALRASLGTVLRPGLVSTRAPSVAALAAEPDRPPLAAAVPTGGVAPDALPAGAAVVLGRERTGLTGAEVAACDLAVTIPAPGFESLNVAAAAAILLYATR
ncbi:MAG TPA: TrmH family RNA methyltransferase [Baekduia sp.]|nr:TrmH family RNA methyltransferase [Baekduia sp.]